MLMPVSARQQLFEFFYDMATRINIRFYSDTPDALLRALLESANCYCSFDQERPFFVVARMDRRIKSERSGEIDWVKVA